MRTNIARVITCLVIVLAGLAGFPGCASKDNPATTGTGDGSYSLTPGVVNVVVAGYINHGPMQPSVNAIKEVLAKYGDKVLASWIDKDTAEGNAFLTAHRLTAHLNVIINGSSSYEVNGKQISFTWFEGDNWTKGDLDAVISGLASKLPPS